MKIDREALVKEVEQEISRRTLEFAKRRARRGKFSPLEVVLLQQFLAEGAVEVFDRHSSPVAEPPSP